jgi:CheY-like chemotaxis protein
VLLVEDHDDTRHAVERLLQRWGYEVESASSVAEAREKAGASRFDILLSDLGLPDGTGTDLMKELRRLGPIAGIAVSGFGMEEDVRRSRDAGFSEHLTKPLNAQRLKAVLHDLADTLPPR